MTQNPRIPDLAALFDRHEKAVLGLSGGKDSLVCLHLLEGDVAALLILV